jgi:hypothetical protein
MEERIGMMELWRSGVLRRPMVAHRFFRRSETPSFQHMSGVRQ